MKEIIIALTPSLNILLGALMALVGAAYQSRANHKNEKIKLKAEKLERAYQLCQFIYDGHLREINNAKRYLPANPTEYLKIKNHPGKEMSELKMLIRCYAPELKSRLSEISKGHDQLKKSLRELENKILSGDALTSPQINNQHTEWDSSLNTVSNGSNIIKAGIEERLLNLAE